MQLPGLILKENSKIAILEFCSLKRTEAVAGLLLRFALHVVFVFVFPAHLVVSAPAASLRKGSGRGS